MAKHTRADLRGLDLDFSTVFITGATSGMGYELTRRFLSKKMKVIAIGRNEVKLQELKALGAITEKLDFGDSDDIQQACKLVDYYKPDLLYHGAGGTEYGDLSDRNPDSLIQELKLHLESLILLLHHFSHLPARKRVFVGFSSALAYTPCCGMSVYSSCKQAIWTLCRLSDIEFQKKGFRVLCCQAGPVTTNFHGRASHGLYQERSSWAISTDKAVDLILWQTAKEFPSLPLGPMAWLAWLAGKCLPFRLVAQTLYKQTLKRANPSS